MHIAVPGNDLASRQFLERRGFSQVRVYGEMRWQGEDVPDNPLPPGFSLRSFAPGDEELLTQLQNAAFGGSWGFCPNTLEEISYRTGLSRCSAEGIVILMEGGKAAAYCWTRVDGNDRERVGIVWMTGVSPLYRGLGLGQSVLLAGMRYLQSRGVQAIELSVDAENLPAISIYLSTGFRKVSDTLWYERRLTA
jgi:mycothiol synthase